MDNINEQILQNLCVQTETLQVLCDQFHNTEKDIDNLFSVLMALAQLSKVNPENYKRLADTLIKRCQPVMKDLKSFQKSFLTALTILKNISPNETYNKTPYKTLVTVCSTTQVLSAN